MRHRLAASFVALWFTAWPLGATEDDVLTFISEMLHGVEATRIDCPEPVTEATRSRDMRVVCAKFNGDFESFESRWQLHLRLEALMDGETGSRRVPGSQPHTDWETRSGGYERIYAVGTKAVGVRFFHGDVLMVYD